MKLYVSTTSPFARKAQAVVIETGLAGRVAMVAAHPFAADSPVPGVNPLGKIPALVLDDGTALAESPLICEYLDTLHGGPSLIPAEGPERWRALRWQTLGDGIMDAGVARRVEALFHPEGQRSEAWVERKRAATARALDALEGEVEALAAAPVSIGHLAVGCALGYLDFRYAADGWRQGRPRLADWYAAFAARPALAETVPSE